MQRPRGLTARQIASLVGGELEGPDITLAGVAPLDRARPGELSLLASGRYLPYFQHTSAGAVLLTPDFRNVSGGPATRIVVGDPRAAAERLLATMYPPETEVWLIDRTAQIRTGARWSGRISIGPGALVDQGVELGEDCVIGTFAVIGKGSQLGDRCRVGSHAVVESGSVLGDNVVLKPGARVGGAGFGYRRVTDEYEARVHVGGCIIGNGVEIGSNSTVDRGSLGDTVIGAGTKIDNLVHVGHNVRIGARCLIMAQVGIAGSTVVGDDAILAGQAGLADHLTVGARARVAAQSGVIGDIEPGATVSGYPARPHREVLRQAAALKRLAPLVDHLENLAQRETHGR